MKPNEKLLIYELIEPLNQKFTANLPQFQRN